MSYVITSPTSLSAGNGTQLAYAASINASGEVAGIGFSNTREVGAIWQAGMSTALSPLSIDVIAYAYGINDQGVVVGQSLSSLEGRHAVSWTNGVVSALSDLGHGSGATAINDQGVIVGSVQTSSGLDEAAMWQNGTLSVLGVLAGGSFYGSGGSRALAINGAGQVVGTSMTGSNVLHGVLWQNGTLTDLGTLPGGTASEATAINASGQIVGYGTDSSGHFQAIQWVNGSAVQLAELPSGGVGDGGEAQAINDNGVIAGYSTTSSGYRAVIWQNGVVTDLNTLLSSNSGWVLTDARGINDRGQIVGDGFYNGVIAEFILTLGGSSTTPSTSVQSALALYKANATSGPFLISDTAANVAGNLDALQTLLQNKQLAEIFPTDSGIPTLSVTPAQLANDTGVLNDIVGSFNLSINASAANLTLQGFQTVSGTHGNTVVFSGTASEYAIAELANHQGVTVTDTGTGRTSVDTLTGINAIQFSDVTVVLASAPSSGTPTAGNITELYGAVFGRVPDVAGLAYYEQSLSANPGQSLVIFAEDFLQSPEYTGNFAHKYAQNTAGETQFVTDMYNNLLHRTPEAGAVPYYLNLISQLTQGMTAGSTAYTKADLAAHATLLVDFSNSAEFLNNVQITAQQPASAQHWLLLL